MARCRPAPNASPEPFEHFAARLDAERAPLAAVEADPRCALLASLARAELGCVLAVAQSEQDAARIRAFYSAQNEAAADA